MADSLVRSTRTGNLVFGFALNLDLAFGYPRMLVPFECRRDLVTASALSLKIAALLLSQPAACIHHFRHEPVHNVLRRDSDIPLRIRNQCSEDLWPAILTQFGQGPSHTGFHLVPGNSTELTVGQDWQGRVWARTNCTFDDNGDIPSSSQGKVTCGTGDCGQFLECQGAVSKHPFHFLLS